MPVSYELAHDPVAGKLATMEGLLTVQELTVDVNVEDTTSTLHKRHIRRREGLSNLRFHPGSVGLIVSHDAIGDIDLHFSLLISTV